MVCRPSPASGVHGGGKGRRHRREQCPARATIYDDLLIATNVIHAAYVSRVEKLMFLGSSCIYPRLAAQPIPEEALLTGPLEPTNEPYAIAKIAGIKMVEAYRNSTASTSSA